MPAREKTNEPNVNLLMLVSMIMIHYYFFRPPIKHQPIITALAMGAGVSIMRGTQNLTDLLTVTLLLGETNIRHV